MKKHLYNPDLIKDNMSEVLIQAPLSVYKEAKEWYSKAHEYALDFSIVYSKPVEVTSALIACLSPQKNWFHNLELTEEFLKNGGNGCRHTRQQVKKAKAIYTLPKHDELMYKKIQGILGGLKTTNFFMNICHPENPNWVTIDVHMAQLMSGDMNYKVPTDKQYEFLKLQIQCFAMEHKMIPTEMQSILWLTWRKIKPRRLK